MEGEHMKSIILLMVLILFFGCAQTPQTKADNGQTTQPAPKTTIPKNEAPAAVKTGDTISVDYIGSLEDGTVFDTTIEAEAKKAGLPEAESYNPVRFKVGAGEMIEGFDNAVIGMKPGEERLVVITPEEAYGPYISDYVVILPNDEKLAGAKIGMYIQTDKGAMGVITAINATNITVDFNHPLAGETLMFKIILRKIN